MLSKIGFGLLWLGFVIYAFIFAPPDQPDTIALITNLSTGKWENINPLIISLFNLMGIWPMVYTCILLIDGRGQKIPAWPFALGSWALGAFALLPYFALRQPNPQFSGQKNLLLNILDARLTGVVLTLGTIVLFASGLINGNWADFIQQWQTSRFIHVMSLDFCVLSLIFPALLGDDLPRRGINNPVIFWLVALIPLFGPVVYLACRPPLQIADSEAIRP
ncbi:MULTISPECIES: hypothetical protein [Planktothricoides]|uniref:DUF2834 domain-containing protein n=2 Tax=Planktothricoides raciborskii TaxID=132608 RepID=A0AAU8J984_9CYAN|nr:MULTISPECIES: hypothetical protein [Planktothricoides]KOR37484.1 hypothetical protein AM228_06175 [Planktothricoides sp. SR001]MBD2543074.1 DUF2834 domain-containing protein [Planktothricoides raciborskii FACHB-1370]MBD2581953.1 DUF2834 domain-containing protein [Planktothricoides raciborskii FACHB-1261]